jgi:HPt (histidine-containing phosphotransfer) domain-containing protein
MIDWSRVRELKDEVGEEDFDEVVELFVEEVKGVLEPMRRGENDATALESDLHFLKGCALNMGFSEFCELCHKGERQAASGEGSAVSIPQLSAAFETAMTRFEAERSVRL